MILNGKSISERIVIEEALVYVPFTCDRSVKTYENEDAEALIQQFEETKQRALNELDALEEKLKSDQSDNTDFIQAHKEILRDTVMEKEIKTLISDEKLYPDSAIIQTYDKYIEVFATNKNKIIQERAADLRDVSGRLLRCWYKKPEKNLAKLEKSCIIVAEELMPTDTLVLDKEHIKGIITEKGGLTSHTAIIARSLDIPALLGVTDILQEVSDGDTIILDGVGAKVVTQPCAEELDNYAIKIEEVNKKMEITRQYFNKEAITKDGINMNLRVNIASADIKGPERAEFVAGVGLFRSEFLYLSKEELPTEEYQFQAYKTVLEIFKDKPVVLRTLDIGGDKQVSYMKLPKEENPFLGNRGIRLCLTHKDIFRSQIRAALRASAFGKLEIMFPMVTSINEFREAKKMVIEVEQELTENGIPWNKDIQIGIMIETPSIALIADQIIDEIDFASVGTNDLTQYLCATDRMNADVKMYYQDYHPAVFRCLHNLAQTFNDAGKCLSVCGELAGDPLAVPVLVGIGLRTLSQSITSIAKSKQIIRNISVTEAELLAKEILCMKSDKDIEKRLKEFEENLVMI